jgi:hypothetical protein
MKKIVSNASGEDFAHRIAQVTSSDHGSDLGSPESKAVATKAAAIHTRWSTRSAQCAIVMTPNQSSDDKDFCEGGGSDDQGSDCN